MKNNFCKSNMPSKAFLFLLILLLTISLPLTILASSSTNKSSLSYLASFQDKISGGLKEEFLNDPQALESDWGIMAFSTSGYDPSTIGDTKNLLDFVKNDACSLSSLTDIERRILALESAGVDTHFLDGCNLPQVIINATQSSGQIGDGLVSTVFGVLALSASDENISPNTVSFIVSNQSEIGGWNSGWGVESNFTSQTIMALVSSGQTIDPSVISNAKNYLKSLQTESGGIKYDGGEWSTESDAFSNSYTLQAINSLDEDPNDPYWLKDGKSILGDLESLRNPDGSFSFSQVYGKMNPVWTTSVALISINKNFLPINAPNLVSWVDKTVTPSPTPTSSVSPTPNPSTSTGTATANTVINSTPISALTDTKTKVLSPTPTKAGDAIENSYVIESPAPSTTSVGKVLSETSGQQKSVWKWVAIIAIFSVLTGAMVVFIERKYVKNQK